VRASHGICGTRMILNKTLSTTDQPRDAGITLSCHIPNLLDKDSTLAKALVPHGHGHGFQILELGSGCGVVGLSLAQTVPGAQVTLTDLPEAEEIVERNITQAHLAEGATVAFRELDWDAELPGDLRASSKKLNLVLAADCTYNPDSRYAVTPRSLCLLPFLTVLQSSAGEHAVSVGRDISWRYRRHRHEDASQKRRSLF
jgi:hypothetical protein